jgi:hypothetical protein
MRKGICFAALVTGASFVSTASANTGVLLPLDQYQAGTEVVNNSIVTNGGFESTTGNQPNGWSLNTPGTGQADTHVGVNIHSSMGSKAAQFGLGLNSDPSKYVQSVTLAPGTDYVLSGYVWNFGNNFDLGLVELVNPGNALQNRNFSLTRSDNSTGPLIDGTRGVFGYKTFNTANLGTTTPNLEAELDFDSFGPWPSIVVQIDNIAITPASQFVAPSLIPEPTTLAVLAGLAGIAMRRRRA